ncbi:MAG: hypothetical protein ACNYNY_02150 [Candidatus Oxydemutatoraceae bacterium WSBS_2016_MAG_OTU14]
MSSTPPIILCMKWGTPYNAADVNLLHRSTRANLARPHRFVCLTDDSNGLDADIEAYPIPDLNISTERMARGSWPKIAVFDSDSLSRYGLEGRVLFLDLDIIITASLDPFIDAPEEFLIIREWARLNDRVRNKCPIGGNSSVFAFNIGAQTHIFDTFMRQREEVYRDYRIEQRFVSAEAKGLAYWPSTWCLSFKRHMMRFFPLPPQHYPPETARIVIFHGRPKPREVAQGGWWGKFPRYGFGPVSFARDYWKKYDLL